MSDKESEIKTGWAKLKQLITLKYEYTKLTLAERLTMILAYAQATDHQPYLAFYH